MTYKKMVEGMVEREATKWLESFIKKDGAFVTLGTVTLKMEKNTCYFDCLVSILGTGSLVSPVYMVAGTVGENGTVYNSVIYKSCYENGKPVNKVVWGATQELRDVYKITSFEI